MRARRGFLEHVRVTHDPAGGIDTHIEFFLLERFEKTRLPIPDVDIVRHDPVGLRKTYLAFEVRLCDVIQVKYYAGIVAAELRALRAGKLPGSLQCVSTRNLEFHGSFRERLKEILIRHARAEQSGENPDQKKFGVVPVESLQRQARLPYAGTNNPSFPMRQSIASIGVDSRTVI